MRPGPSKQASAGGPRRPRARQPEQMIAAVIAAGGRGARVGGRMPKQFLRLDGKPILLHTVERILELSDLAQVVIAAPAGHIRRTREIIRPLPAGVPVTFVRGGRERQDSVQIAVARVRPGIGIILVHDAVRPLCDRATMERVVQAARETGGAVPGLPVTETIQRVSRRGRILQTPRREELYAIQTPQCFRAEILRSSLERARQKGFVGSDESSVVRWAGHTVAVVLGSPTNIKITRPLDLDVGERLLARQAGRTRVEGKGAGMQRLGQGMDYHRLQKGRRLVLGGVEIPFEMGLAGHSDADVLAHAVCDALLGAAAMGDIGRHFPDTDARHQGRSSLEFLHEVRDKLNQAGWRIVNVDATVLAQRPRIAPFFEAMQQNMARALGIARAQVSVKATTSEGMNAEGRGEGISAHAVAMIERDV
jgi:2-C-methyl-D-erythritol 4-phosphate cytidylyltransferase/2-C-methyl-D-erythritol 2,4-cyclodiphosphate synthase